MSEEIPREKAFGAYLQRSMTPLHCLVFLLPFLVFYEIGLAFIRSHRINAAHALMLTILKWVGVSAYYAPAICVVVIFLIWQIAGRHSWKVRPATLLAMLAEAVVFTLPLVILHNLFVVIRHRLMALSETAGHLAASGIDAVQDDWFSELVLSTGAGIYEELAFRLVLVAGMAFLIERLCRMSRQGSILLAVLISAGLFSAFHYWGASGYEFQWHSFLFRTAAAIYLSVLFASRGFGITAGAHMLFNCAVTLFSHFA
ncbi:MAG: CPBP family intramembrane metalloprotease [Phycisphaerae bacterium]|nr:CPBP family intramembrane metalloprotease [Phycisphaerae bacterium]